MSWLFRQMQDSWFVRCQVPDAEDLKFANASLTGHCNAFSQQRNSLTHKNGINDVDDKMDSEVPGRTRKSLCMPFHNSSSLAHHDPHLTSPCDIIHILLLHPVALRPSLLLVVIITLQRLLSQPLGLFPQRLGDLLVPALGGAGSRADPSHLQFELLVLAVLVCEVDDARGLLDALLQGEGAFVKVELLELCLGGLPAFARRGTVVALFPLTTKRPTASRPECDTYPVQATRLNHVEERAAVSDTLLLASSSDRRTAADLAVNLRGLFAIPATNDGRHAERAHARVEGVRLDEAAHAVGERSGLDGALVHLPPLRSLVTSSGNEVASVRNETGRDLWL